MSANSDAALPVLAYCEFWDVPRIFIAESAKRMLLFWCPFDEQLEDYRSFYQVFELFKPSGQAFLATRGGSWNALLEGAGDEIERVEISQVKFDATRRKSVDPASLPESLR